MIQQKSNWYLMKTLQQIGYSRLMVLKKTMKVKEIRLKIYEFVRPLIQVLPSIKRFKHDKTEKTYSEIL